MIEGFAKTAPEEVRSMFIALFDESNDVVTRILKFKDKSSLLLEKYGNGAGQHYQYENAVSTYLWLRFPDKYYIYKYGEVKAVADELDSDYRFKKVPTQIICGTSMPYTMKYARILKTITASQVFLNPN